MLAPGRQAYARLGHGDAGHRNHAHKVKRVDGFAVGQRRAGHAHQAVDGHRFGVWLQVGQLRNQARTVHRRLAHAHNAAAAHADACSAHVLQRVQPVLIGPGAHHVGVVLGGGVQVVVVVVQPGVFQRLRLVRFEHAQRGAGLQAQAFHGANQGADFFNVAVFGRPPGGAHAKAGGARVLGGLGGAHYLLHFHELFGLHAGVELGRLRAVAAVFRAATRFHRQERGQFNVARRPVLAVHRLGLENQLQQRLVEQLLNRFDRPRARLASLRRRGAVDVDGLGRRAGVHACSLNGVCGNRPWALAVTTPCVVPGRWACNRADSGPESCTNPAFKAIKTVIKMVQQKTAN